MSIKLPAQPPALTFNSTQATPETAATPKAAIAAPVASRDAFQAGAAPGLFDTQKAASVQRVQDGAPQKTKTVMIFGLSANPPTGLGGHAGIVNWGATSLKVDVKNEDKPELNRDDVKMDEVWVLPVYKHAFSAKKGLLDFDHRVAMSKLAFENLPGLEGRVKVKDTERVVIEEALSEGLKTGITPDKVRVGTIDIIRRLMADHADTQFVLALGGDTYADLTAGKWKEGDKLLKMLPIVVIPRKGVDGVAGSEDAPQLSDISSTKVRGSTDLEFLKTAVHPDVLQYMVEHKLYAFAGDEQA